MSIMNQELFLVHYGKFSWADVQDLIPGERNWHFDQLIKIQKQQQNDLGKLVQQ